MLSHDSFPKGGAKFFDTLRAAPNWGGSLVWVYFVVMAVLFAMSKMVRTVASDTRSLPPRT